MPDILQHPLSNPRYTQQFGERVSVYGGRGHMGVDYGCSTGTPIFAVADGEVDKSANDAGGYGLYVRIWHPSLKCYSLYGHFSQHKVKVGDQVKQGQVVGLSGNTGNSTGPHLHYEIRLASAKDVWVPVVGFSYSQVDPVAFHAGVVRNPNATPEPPPPPESADTVTIATSTGQSANIRNGPGLSNRVVGSARQGTKGKAVGRNIDSSWVQVEIGSSQGWILATLVRVTGGVPALPVTDGTKPPVEPPPSTGNKPFTVATATGQSANIRSGPGTNNRVVGSARQGTVGEAVGRNADSTWVQVKVGTIEGWIMGTLVRVDGGIPSLPSTSGTSPPTAPPSGDDKFLRSMKFVARWEGGWADHPSDPGGATMKGITIGTYTRWRKAKGLPAPTKAQLRAITDEEVHAIYRAWYWEASGADKMAWPMCLAHFDLAVNGGVGRAAQALAARGQNFEKYMSWREAWYRTLSGFPTFGTAWLRRCKDLRAEAAK